MTYLRRIGGNHVRSAAGGNRPVRGLYGMSFAQLEIRAIATSRISKALVNRADAMVLRYYRGSDDYCAFSTGVKLADRRVSGQFRQQGGTAGFISLSLSTNASGISGLYRILVVAKVGRIAFS